MLLIHSEAFGFTVLVKSQQSKSHSKSADLSPVARLENCCYCSQYFTIQSGWIWAIMQNKMSNISGFRYTELIQTCRRALTAAVLNNYLTHFYYLFIHNKNICFVSSNIRQSV